MSVEALKEQARGHEQNEQWQKALDLYIKAMDRMSEEDVPDIGLYNRAGDLATRTGASTQAVSFYGPSTTTSRLSFPTTRRVLRSMLLSNLAVC